jgi:hypothetical protein
MLIISSNLVLTTATLAWEDDELLLSKLTIVEDDYAKDKATYSSYSSSNEYMTFFIFLSTTLNLYNLGKHTQHMKFTHRI